MYKILKAYTASKLEEEVNDYMNQGWTPLGGVVVIRYNSEYETYWEYSQAMIIWKGE